MKKAQIRTLKKQQRKALSNSSVTMAGEKISEKFFSTFDFDYLDRIKSVHAYLPITKNNEVDTTLVIERIWEEHPNVEIYVPYIDDISDSMNSDELVGMKLTSFDGLEKNKFGILQPNKAKSLLKDIHKIDIILVPLLAFDLQGHRLGYGSGYYDRLLSKVREGTLKVGLGYEISRYNGALPNGHNDIKLDYVITEERVYEF
ncbi:MAG: 5-formyltetrahydrofolate cyclo-ligase [candidate division WS6 bacterium GW2011_GWA2_37_6]|uniref:5-formyltetrahydrofolate cyclo-ligase n=1 Tax=candidate division WS6 bacterium GW2011_GWA2_37_6 TaxID=1619087 RepID=A0A0G0GZ13_9BACT|nr:MAG: 5-formyltetrahydrofolate cyclo-ligase [candidate division WS6 bacterium GW2011_GWA2_37_6]